MVPGYRRRELKTKWNYKKFNILQMPLFGNVFGKGKVFHIYSERHNEWIYKNM